jgi:hypothetical protein
MRGWSQKLVYAFKSATLRLQNLRALKETSEIVKHNRMKISLTIWVIIEISQRIRSAKDLTGPLPHSGHLSRWVAEIHHLDLCYTSTVWFYDPKNAQNQFHSFIEWQQMKAISYPISQLSERSEGVTFYVRLTTGLSWRKYDFFRENRIRVWK